MVSDAKQGEITYGDWPLLHFTRGGFTVNRFHAPSERLGSRGSRFGLPAGYLTLRPGISGAAGSNTEREPRTRDVAFQTGDSKCYTAEATGLRAMASQAREVMVGRELDTSNNDRDR